MLRYRRTPEEHHRDIPEALQPLANKINRQDGYANVVLPTSRCLCFFHKSAVLILLPQVFSEAHELSVEFLLLDLYDHDFFLPFPISNPGRKIQSVNG